MSDLILEICGQIDDMDGSERTLLWADTTADTESFGDVGNLGFGSHFDAELAGADHGAGLLAFLATFLI